MDLNFTKKDNLFVAEFEATNDFNIHIERIANGLFVAQQRTTTEGIYANIDDLGYLGEKRVVDIDFVGVIYPKSVKIISASEPTKAVVTFNE